MPATFGIIAAFLGDLDTSDGVGKVIFRQDTSPELLQRIGEQISQAFPDEGKIEPIHAFVVTWVNVAAQGAAGSGDGSHKPVSPFTINQGCLITFFFYIGFHPFLLSALEEPSRLSGLLLFMLRNQVCTQIFIYIIFVFKKRTLFIFLFAEKHFPACLSVYRIDHLFHPALPKRRHALLLHSCRGSESGC